MFAGTHLTADQLKPRTSSLDRMKASYRNGHHATVYDVRRDPSLQDKNIIRDRSKPVFPFVSGSSYKGQWKEDVREGFGTEVNPDGTKYEGEWLDNKRHGKGTLFVKQGKKLSRTYVGEWAKGSMEGFGVYYYPSGEIYRGEWMNNQRSGKGRLDTSSGNNEYYDGEWANDKKNGFGVFYHENGNTYEGLWMDEKEGPGKFFYAATGKVYEGEWVEDQPKCGEYRQPTVAEQSKFHPATIRRESFVLPEIGLEAPGDVLETATTNARIENAERRGITSSVTLSEAKVSELRGIFHSVPNAVTGLVALAELEALFANLGLPPLDDPTMISLFQDLELTLESEVTFAEAIDISQFLLQF
jgi:hypothetical protein